MRLIRMALTIDISNLPNQLRSILLQDLKIETTAKPASDLVISSHAEDMPNLITLTSENDIQIVKRKLKDLLIKNKVRDYIVISDKNETNKIIILERNHVETSQLFHCIHCGMEFEDEIHLSVHHRIHYLL